MPRYYVNNRPQPESGDHEVHATGCYWLQLAESTTDLGDHYTCSTAVAAARVLYPTADGCVHCSPSCHRG